MTITLHWWMVPALLLALAVLWFFIAPNPRDYDFVTPLLNVGVLVLLVVGAVMFSLGALFT